MASASVEEMEAALAAQTVDINARMEALSAAIAKRLTEIVRLRNALSECLDYFEARADADHNGHNFVPNEEMVLAQVIKQALGQ